MRIQLAHVQSAIDKLYETELSPELKAATLESLDNASSRLSFRK
jgi:hypothetical protein